MITNLNELTKKESLTIRKLTEQYYLLSGTDCYKVNITGAMIVNSLGRDVSIDELCNKLSVKFDFENITQIKSDVYDFVKFLFDEGLVSYNE